MGVERPGVGVFDAGDERRPGRRRPSPQPERAVHVQPGAALVRRPAHFAHRIARAGVHVARLYANDRPRVEGGQPVRPHPPLTIGRHPHHATATQSEEAERFHHAHVHLVAHDNGKRWSAEQPIGLHVPARPLEQRVPRRGEAREVRHRRARDEPAGGLRRQMQRLQQPAQGHRLERRRARREHCYSRVLIPRRCEHVRGNGRGEGSAHHEAEEAPAGARDRGRRPARVELAQHGKGIGRPLGEGPVEGSQAVERRDGGGNGARGKRVEIVGGERGGGLEQLSVGHVRVHCSPSPESLP